MVAGLIADDDEHRCEPKTEGILQKVVAGKSLSSILRFLHRSEGVGCYFGKNHCTNLYMLCQICLQTFSFHDFWIFVENTICLDSSRMLSKRKRKTVKKRSG